MKKHIAFVATLFFALTTLSGCNQNNSKSDPINKTESFFYKTVDTCLLNEDENLIDLNFEDNQLILTKNISKKIAEITSFDTETGQTKTHSLDYSDFEAGLSEDIQIISDDDNFYLLCPGQTTSFLYTINKNQENISCIDLQMPSVDKICTDGNGTLYVAYYQYDTRNQYIMLERYQNNQKIDNIELSALLADGNVMDICDIYADHDGNRYVLYTMNNVVFIAKISSEQTVTAKAEVNGIFGNDNHIIVSGQGELLVMNRDESGLFLINRINTDTCETIDFYEEVSADSILSGVSGYDYIAVNSDGFSGVDMESGTHELLQQDVQFQSANCVNGNELITVSVKNNFNNVLVKVEKDTNKTLSEITLETENDCCIVDAAYHNDKHIYLCQDNSKQYLLITDTEGKTEKTMELDNIAKGRAQNVCADETGCIYLVSKNDATFYYQKFDRDLKVENEIKVEDIKDVKRVISVDDSMYSDNLDGMIYKLNFEQNKIEKNDLGCHVYDCYSYDDKMLVQDDFGVIYTYQDNTLTEVLNCNELDQINSMGISDIYFEGINDFYVWSDNDQKLYEINKVNTADIKNAKILNVAYDIDSASMKKMISEFSSENENIMFKLSDYSTDEKIEKLNMDIASGNVPDIIISDGRIDLSVYENMDVMEDLSGYFEKDSTINSDDYFMNVFLACSNTGKLNQIVPKFRVITGFGKTSILGEEKGWDYAEFLDKISANPQKDILFSGLFQNNVRYIDILYFNLVDMIDFEHKKFNVDEHYAKVLAALKPYMYSDIEDGSNYSKNELSEEFDMRFRSDKILFDVMDIGTVDDICSLKDAVVNDDIVFKGLPSANGDGSYVHPITRIAMLTSCTEKDAAWSFMKKYLSDAYQENTETDSFPVKKSSFNKSFDKCEERKLVLGDEAFDVHVPSENDRTMIVEWIASLSKSICSENRLASIIYNELGCYLDDLQNEDETLKEIKRKIELYLSEI